MHPTMLRFADPRWVARVRRGVGMMLAAALGIIISVGIAFLVLASGSIQRSSGSIALVIAIVIAIVMVTMVVLGIVGIVQVTTPDPWARGKDRWPSVRSWL